MSDPLPVEILQTIFGFVQQHGESLLPWSLTCPTFHQLAQVPLFHTVRLYSCRRAGALEGILLKARSILPLVKQLYIIHGHHEDISLRKTLLHHPSLALILRMLHDEGHIEELEVSWSLPSGRPRWAKLSWEHDFSNDIKQALQDLIRCRSLNVLHLESIHDIPAAETFELSTLKRLSLHKVVVDARDSLLLGPQGSVIRSSDLEVIQVSGNGAAVFLEWFGTHYQTPNLKRISISIPLQPDDTISGLDEIAAVNRPIIANWESLEQIDIYSNRADSLDPGPSDTDLDLSQHHNLKILAKRIDYYCDTDYAHLPPPTPSLVRLISTIDPDSTLQIRLTFYAHFLSLSSFGSLAGIDLTPLANVLEGKSGVSLQIWVCSNWPIRTAAIKVLLENQLGRLGRQGRLRVQTTEFFGDARFWGVDLR